MKQLQTLVILLTICVFTGCGLNAIQQEGVARFAKASAGVGDFSARELSQLREATIEMNTKDIAINGKAKLTDLDESFDADDISARISASTALSSYGKLLLALVEETQEAELKDASDQFVDSFRRVSGKNLNDEQLESLGTLVRGIGGLFIEYKKAKAVKKIVVDAKDDIDIICNLLIADFTRTELGLAQGVDVTIKRVKADADIALAMPTVDFQSRLIAVEAYRFADDSNARLTIVGKKAIETLTALKLANSQLVATIQEDKKSISDIRTLGSKIKELADATRVLSGN